MRGYANGADFVAVEWRLLIGGVGVCGLVDVSELRSNAVWPSGPGGLFRLGGRRIWNVCIYDFCKILYVYQCKTMRVPALHV